MGDPETTFTPIRPEEIKTNPKPKAYHVNPLQRKLVVMNCQLLTNKKFALNTLLSSVQPDIIIGTESWLTKDHLNSEYFPPNYNVYRNDRPDRGGGVLS